MKRKIRNTMSGLLATFMCISISIQLFAPVDAATTQDIPYTAATSFVATASTSYFYNQLTEDAKLFYHAMQEMLSSGVFKTGTENYDLTANGLSQEKIEAHVMGSIDLLSQFGAARDAFYADYPDVFYVDFSNLSLRITQDGSGYYHAYLGTGRYNNYYTEGFTSVSQVERAISDYEAARDEIVKGAKAVAVDEGENLTVKQIEYVHDAITHSVSYRLENACKPENIGFIRTSYGALVKHEGVCEAYTRAFKSIMDELGIPCIMVEGVYMHTENTPELHIWNYVQVESKWYGVDVTMDDPKGGKSNNGVDGHENRYYLLCGESAMNRNHVPNGVLSEANFEFTYPQLASDSLGVETTQYDNGLVVRYRKDGEFEGIPAGEYWVSFDGMGYAEAAKNGYYMLTRFRSLNKEGNWEITDWGYITPELYPAIEDSATEIHLPLPHAEYIEFGVTDIAPGNYFEDLSRLFYKGDPLLLVAQSGMLHNENGSYVAPPYPKSVSPAMTGRLGIEQTHHIVVEFDDVLVEDGTAKPGITFACEALMGTTTGEQYSKVENFKWDGKSTISFDFTPSKMWADDNVLYTFSVKGLIGSYSGKSPISFGYVASYLQCATCKLVTGYDWSVFGKPTLMENIDDLDMSNWTTADGQEIADELKNRLALVVTNTTHAQQDLMDSLVESEFGEKILTSQTYNINLTVCKSQIIKTGQSVKVSLGFPEGYGPEDTGVTFKAYHFKKDDTGTIIGVEEIPCVITPYGLLITCDAFSPFSIVAVEADPDAPVNRTVILGAGIGGKTTSSDGSVYVVNEGESTTITIEANEGYVIDTLTYAGKYQTISNQKTMTITLTYDELVDGANIIDARFITAETASAEQAKGENAVQPQAVAATVELDKYSIELDEGDSLEITAEVSSGDHAFQWYKDGQPLKGQTGRSLRIDSATVNYIGHYTLAVTTFLGATSATVTSDACIVSFQGELPEEHLLHSFDDWNVLTEPTCQNVGKKERICSACGYQELQEIAIIEHSYKDGVCIFCGAEDNTTDDTIQGDQSASGSTGTNGGNENGNTISTNSNAEHNSASTGDATPIVVLTAMLLISACAAFGTIKYKKRVR